MWSCAHSPQNVSPAQQWTDHWTRPIHHNHHTWQPSSLLLLLVWNRKMGEELVLWPWVNSTYLEVKTSSLTTILRQHIVSLTCGQAENVLFIGIHMHTIIKKIIWFILGFTLISRWGRTIPSHHKQKVLLLVSEVHNSTATLLHWCPILWCCGGQHPPLQSGGAQCVNAIVVAATVTTPTTKVVQVIPDSYTGIAPYSQWRCSTCGTLLPATSVHVEHLHAGQERSLLSTVVYTRQSSLLPSPRVHVHFLHNISCTVPDYGDQRVPSIHPPLWGVTTLSSLHQLNTQYKLTQHSVSLCRHQRRQSIIEQLP